MKKNIERGIRFKAATIYIIVIAACFLLFLYMFSLRDSMEEQKSDMENSRHTLALTNELVIKVNKAQSDAGIYVSTGKNGHLSDYKKDMADITSLVDSLQAVTKDRNTIEMLDKINALLEEKREIITQLYLQFSLSNPIEIINQSIKEHYAAPQKDSVYILLEKKDSVVKVTPKKNFFRRLSEAFNPKKIQDSTITVSSVSADTTYISSPPSGTIVSQLDSAAKVASRVYIDNLKSIENQIVKLVAIEENISEQLSSILLDLHKKTLDSTMEEISKREKALQRNYNYSLIGISISMLLILIFIILIISDVNKGYSARTELEKANALTRSIMESRHKLLLSVTHDIKTPLASILGYIELWKENDGKTDSEQLLSMQNSGNYILAMLENLLEFSSLEKGSVSISESDFNLMQLCRGIIGMFTPLANQKGLRIENRLLFENELTVRSDSLKVRQIIINILSNAVKYTAKGGVKIEVSHRNGKTDISISDTGAGIPEDKLDSVFKPFFRVADNNPLAEGSGFGMFVVKGLVELLDGTISIESEVGKGTTVHVSIPMQKTDSQLSGGQCGTQHQAKKILVVDDNASFLSMVGEMLKKTGHQVVLSNSPEEFRKAEESNSDFDYILTDMEMENFSGEDILSIVRKKQPRIPVIIMTAHGDFTLEKAVSIGFDGFLKKPFTISEIAEVFGCASGDEHKQASLLEDMFEGDTESIREVLEVFKTSTAEHVTLLQKALEEDDMERAQFICHKMYSMFAQIGETETAELLKKMDSARGKTPDEYPTWRDDIREIIALAQKVYNCIP